MRTLKRTKHITAEEGRTLAKRMRIVEARSLANRPEMRTITFRLNNSLAAGAIQNAVLTNIAQGTNTNERTGNEIRVWRVQIRGKVDSRINLYINQLHTTSEPTAAVYGPGRGSYLLDNESNTRFTEWAYVAGIQNVGENNINRVVRFKGMRTHYNGTTSTSGIKNGVCVTALNNDSSAREIDVSCRIWYTDA